jgi:hypothetical protein
VPVPVPVGVLVRVSLCGHREFSSSSLQRSAPFRVVSRVGYDAGRSSDASGSWSSRGKNV